MLVYRLTRIDNGKGGDMNQSNNVGGILLALLLGAVVGFFAGYKYHEHVQKENNTIRFELGPFKSDK